jgi:cation-transporting ATPase E
LILLNDSFIVLPEVLLEGQRILTGMQDILKLFLTRIIYVALLMLSTGFVGSFPLSPKNSSIMVLLTVGLPSLAVALWAKPGLVSHRGLTRSLFRFVVPASLSLSLGGLLVFIVYLIIPSILMGQSLTAGGAEINVSPTDQMMAQTALVTYSIFCGLLLLLFIEPPSKFWVGGQILSTDRRPTYLACFLCAAYLAILLSPGIRHFFDMAALNIFDLVFLGGMAALWALFLRWIWRSRVFDRFLSLDFGGE